ncbi:hypothetical protein BD289DRAFT_445613, partial [Coniella lustricola]
MNLPPSKMTGISPGCTQLGANANLKVLAVLVLVLTLPSPTSSPTVHTDRKDNPTLSLIIYAVAGDRAGSEVEMRYAFVVL